MPQKAVAELLETYRSAATLAEAEAALHSLERLGPADQVGVGELYDGLAEVAAEEGDFALATRAQRRALELGCEYQMLGREMLGWYLTKEGRRSEGEAEFDALRAERGDDPQLLIMLGCARSDAGHEVDALAAFDEALAAAKRNEDADSIDQARAERKESRAALGLPPDAEDRLAPRPRFMPAGSKEASIAIAWFPRDEHGAALDRWPDLRGDLADPDAYCRRIERHLQDALDATGRRPSVAPLRVEALVAEAERAGLDPGAGSFRAHFAAGMHTRGETLHWPPGRNDPCWCRSGRKYKRCCGSLS